VEERLFRAALWSPLEPRTFRAGAEARRSPRAYAAINGRSSTTLPRGEAVPDFSEDWRSEMPPRLLTKHCHPFGFAQGRL